MYLVQCSIDREIYGFLWNRLYGQPLPWDPTERRELSRASVLFMLDVEAQMMRRQDFAPLVQKTGTRTLLQSQHHEQSEQRQEGKEANP